MKREDAPSAGLSVALALAPVRGTDIRIGPALLFPIADPQIVKVVVSSGFVRTPKSPGCRFAGSLGHPVRSGGNQQAVVLCE